MQAVVVDDTLYSLTNGNGVPALAADDRALAGAEDHAAAPRARRLHPDRARKPRTRSSTPCSPKPWTATSTARSATTAACTGSSTRRSRRRRAPRSTTSSRPTSSWRRTRGTRPATRRGDCLRDSPWVSDFYEFMGEHVFDADLSVSVPMLDSLMEPGGVIVEAQKMAAKAFGARRTFFATNGTSTANKVMLPDPARARRKAAARPQLPQVRPPRRGPVRRAPDLPRLFGQPASYGIYGPVPREDHPRRDRSAPGRAGADPHLLHLRRAALRPAADRRGGARERHQGDRRRGLVRLCALPSGVPPDRARSRRRLRDPVHAQGALGVLAGVDDPRQRPGFRRAHVPRELQHAHVHQPAVRDDREPRRGAQAGGHGRLQAARAHARPRPGVATADQFHRRVPRARARGPAAGGGARTTASGSIRPRSRSTSRAAAIRWRSCRTSCSSASTSRWRNRPSIRSHCCSPSAPPAARCRACTTRSCASRARGARRGGCIRRPTCRTSPSCAFCRATRSTAAASWCRCC